RGRTDEEDRRMAGELTEHPKERAEHVMLLDLARNDVGRVVEFGTEKVDELMTLERYSHVMHMTSQVSGRLIEGKGPIDVLRATLPAGPVSGGPADHSGPKARAGCRRTRAEGHGWPGASQRQRPGGPPPRRAQFRAGAGGAPGGCRRTRAEGHGWPGASQRQRPGGPPPRRAQ